MLERFKRQRKEGPPQSPHEIAKYIRDVQLNMFDYGVIGSNTDLPQGPDPKAVKLPHLLRYSPTILQHMQTLIGILRAPRDFQITNQPDTGWMGKKPDGDVIYSKNGKNHEYEFAHHLTSPYLNAWAAAFDKLAKEEPMLITYIIQQNELDNGTWYMGYRCRYWSNPNPNTIGSNYFPERDKVLNFMYSPIRLDGKSMYKKMGFAPVVRDRVTFMGEVQKGNFRSFIYHFDALSFADLEAKQSYVDDLAERYSSFLRKKGNVEFAIVEVGTVTLNGKKHWVYTGSEQSGIEVPEEQNVPKAARILQRLFTPSLA